MLDPGQPLYDAWSRIPDNTDVLITHGPPRGVLDMLAFTGAPVGCPVLREVVRVARVPLLAKRRAVNVIVGVWPIERARCRRVV